MSCGKISNSTAELRMDESLKRSRTLRWGFNDNIRSVYSFLILQYVSLGIVSAYIKQADHIFIERSDFNSKYASKRKDI